MILIIYTLILLAVFWAGVKFNQKFKLTPRDEEKDE